jgi:hypothetical protein
MRSPRFRSLVALLLPAFFAGALAARGQGATAAPAATPPPCQEPERRQFDFWLGDWEVATADGTVRGRNVIESIEGGCALRESYVTGRGYSGTSYNFFDPVRKLWHQTWIDNQGSPLYLDGNFEAGRMVLRGDLGGTLQRITWTPLADGRVRQLWESSTDGGSTWTTAFDGYYSRRK